MVDDDDDLRFGDVSGSDDFEGLDGLPDTVAQLVQTVIMLFILAVVVWTLGQTALDMFLLM